MKTTLIKTGKFLGNSQKIASKETTGLKLALFMLFILLGTGTLSAQTWDGGASDDNWSSASNWSPNGVPAAGGAVIIPPGFPVVVTANATCASLTYTANGTASNTLTINNGVTLTVTGAITINNDNSDNRAVTFTGAGAITAASLTLGGTTTSLDDDATTALTSTVASLTLSGNLNINAEDDVSDENLTTFSIGSGTVTVGGTLVLDSDTSDNDADARIRMDVGSQNGTLNLSGSPAITLTGAGDELLDFDGSGNTVNYNRAGTQTVNGLSYRNLTISGSNTKTLGAATTVLGTLTVHAGNTLALSTFALGAPTSTVLECGATAGSAITGTGALTLGGNLTVNDAAGAGTGGASIAAPVALGATRTFTVANDGSAASDLTISSIISGTAFGIVKAGAGTMTLSAANSYTGATTISAGELRLNPAANVTPNSQMILNGGELSTTGITAARTIANSSALRLDASSTINLESNNHTLSFANSSGQTWNGTTLTINGWTGTGGASGTGGKIFVGNAPGSLSNGQLAKITFTGYPGAAKLLATGELVPQATTPVLAITGTTAHGTACVGSATSAITYTVTNTGFNAAAGVTVVSNNPQFVVSNLSSTSIAGNGGTITYNVTFTASGSGAQNAVITVASTTSGSNSPTSNLTGSGALQPTASAGGSKTICSNGTATLGLGEATATNGTISWSHNGTGNITAGGTTLTPTYTAATADGGHTVILTMTVSNSPCTAAQATYAVIVNAAATVDAGSPQTVCATNTITLAGTRGGSATSSTWSASSGTFGDASSLTSTYAPGIASGTVTLTLTTDDPEGPCGVAVDTVVITVNAAATVDAGSPQTVCSNGSITLAGTRGGAATSSTWSATSGTFGNASSLSSSYTPGIASGTVTLTLTTNNPTGLCDTVSDTVVITVNPAATASAGANQTVCAGQTITLDGSIGGGATSSAWSAPSGTFGDASSLTSAYTPSIASGTVVLTLTTDNPDGPCSAETSTMTVTVNPVPTTAGTTICVGESGSLTSTTICPTISGTETASGSGGTSDSTTYSGSGNTNIAIAFPSLPAGAAVTSTAVTITYTAVNLVSTRSDLRVRATPPAAVGAAQTDLQPSTQNSAGTVTNAVLGTWGTGNPTGNWLFEFREVTNDLFLGFIPATDANISNITITVGYSIDGVLHWYTTSSGGTPIGSGSPFNPVGVLNSGLIDTQTAGTTTFYAECATVPGCRTATPFVINPLPVVSFTTLASYYCESAAVVNLAANQAGGSFSGAGITNNGAGTAIFNPATAGVGPHVITYTYTNENGCTNTAAQNVSINANATYYADSDADGFGDLASPQVSCIGAPDGYVSNGIDCNDGLLTYVDADGDGFGINTFSACSGITNALDCNDALLTYVDADGDTYGSSALAPCGVPDSTDCNDGDNTKHEIFTFYIDTDGDGFGSAELGTACAVDALTPPAGYSLNDTDCNVTDPAMHDVYPFYADNDDDGFGAGAIVNLCAANAATSPDGDYVVNGTDCNDSDAAMHASFNFYEDLDQDGYGSTNVYNLCAVNALTPPAGYSLTNTDCDDTKTLVHPNAPEVGYNLIDDDCDGSIDEGFPPISTTISQCNYTLGAIDAYVYANIVAGAQGYRWRVTAMSGPTSGQVQFLDTPLRVMRITQLTNYAFNTTYKMEVAVYYAGFLQPFTASNCTVSTPATLTQLTSCGSTAVLNVLGDAAYAVNVPFAAGYKFKITDPSNPSNTQELVRATREFRMTLITAFPVQYNKTYNVQVSVKNTDGTYLVYGPACNLTTPVFPTTSLQDSQCDDYTVASQSTQIYANSYPGVITYVFQVKGPGLPPAGVEVSKLLRSFTLADFPGLAPGTLYNVRVRLVFNVNDPVGPFGKTCSIMTPASAKVQSGGVKNVFSAVTYPNPFAESFNINVTTAAASKVNVKIYDMTGRLLETKDADVSEMKTLQVGNHYPAGVYNVIVSQDDNVRTLRVIKR